MGVTRWWEIWHYALIIIGMLVLGSIYYFGFPLTAVYPVIIAAVITAFLDERWLRANRKVKKA